MLTRLEFGKLSPSAWGWEAHSGSAGARVSLGFPFLLGPHVPPLHPGRFRVRRDSEESGSSSPVTVVFPGSPR